MTNIRSEKPKVGLMLASLEFSGGTSVAVNHIASISKDYEITIIVPDGYDLKKNDYSKKLANTISIKRINDIKFQFDLVIITFWFTYLLVYNNQLKSKNWIYFVQSLEDRFYANPKELRLNELQQAQKSYFSNIPVLTEAHWISAVIKGVNPSQKVYLVRNPIDGKNLDLPRKQNSKTFVIIVEGHDAWFKGMQNLNHVLRNLDESNYTIHIVGADIGFKKLRKNIKVISHGKLAQEKFHALLAKSNLLLKLSYVEGMYGPPLEGFKLGITVITTNVTGNEEYIKHLKNAIVVPHGDTYGVSNWVKYLNKNRATLTELSENAIKTANNWPSRSAIENQFEVVIRKNLNPNLQAQTLNERYPNLQAQTLNERYPNLQAQTRNLYHKAKSPLMKRNYLGHTYLDLIRYAIYLLKLPDWILLGKKTIRYMRKYYGF